MLMKNYKMIFSWGALLVYLLLFSQGVFQGLDTFAYNFISSFRHETLTSLMIGITSLGAWYSMVIIAVIILLIDKRKGLIMSANMIFITILNYLIKITVMRPRPFVEHLVRETSFSFPSGHSMVSFAVFGLITYYLYPKHKFLSYAVMILPIFIGLTRIYLGVHYATDVIGGFLFSFAWLCTIIPLLKKNNSLSIS